MKNKLLFLLCIFTGSLVAKEEVQTSFPYVGFGLGPFPVLVPSFSAGYRTQEGHHGADLSIYGSTLVFITELKTSALYHYYFKPNLCSQFYIGGGFGMNAFLDKKFRPVFGKDTHVYLSPEFVFGKQYINEAGDTRFFQAQISWPTFPSDGHHRPFYMPLVVFSYGIGF